MRFLGLDTETTGLDVEKGHRIVEICADLYEWDFVSEPCRVGRGYTQRINPERPIDAAARAVHGISSVDLRGCPTWEKVAPTVHKLLSSADYLIAHNAPFDVSFVGTQLVQAGLEPPNIQVFCTMDRGRFASPYGEPPNLGRLCWALGVEYDDSKAHAADFDVSVMMQCFFRGVDWGVFDLDLPAMGVAA